MDKIKTTARLTGMFYLGLAITGGFGFLMVRGQLFDPADPAATLANLIAHQGLARLGLALELGIVLTQALAGVWFWKLFRGVDGWAAGSIAAFALVNSSLIAISAVALNTGLQVALSPALAPGGDAAATVQLSYQVSEGCWMVGQVFFGLWLVPMGHAVRLSGWMPRGLGWTLMIGGAAYVLAAFASVLPAGPNGMVVLILTVPATIGEFWMIGYLLIFGVRAGAELPAR